METKTCPPCNDNLFGIEHCSKCQQNNDEVRCMECEGPWFTTYEQDACVRCKSDEFENELGDCEKCSNQFDNCGACGRDEEGDLFCKACLPGIPWIEEDGEYVGCGCSFVEYVHLIDPIDRTEAECRPCLSMEGHEACDVCSQETWWSNESGMWETELFCEECQIPYFSTKEGECSMEACAVWDEFGECLKCNKKSDFIYIP